MRRSPTVKLGAAKLEVVAEKGLGTFLSFLLADVGDLLEICDGWLNLQMHRY